MIRLLLLLSFCTCLPLHAFEEEQLIGEWVLERPRNILGTGMERRVIFAAGDKGGLTLSFKSVHHGEERTRQGKEKDKEKEGAPAAPLMGGPYRVKQISANELVYVRDSRELHVTIRLHDSGALEWGAIVSEDNKTWRYACDEVLLQRQPGGETKEAPKTSGTVQWTFLSDPFETPVGEAEVPGLIKGTAFYIFEKLPSYETGEEPQRTIRVMTRNEDRSLSEQFRMVWTKNRGIRVGGTLLNGENVRHPETFICEKTE